MIFPDGRNARGLTETERRRYWRSDWAVALIGAGLMALLAWAVGR